MGIWTPTNKFESDITVKLEMLQIDLRREEMELSRTEYELAEVERNIDIYSDNIEFLRKKAKIVSSRDYAAIRAEIPKLVDRRKVLNALTAQHRQIIRSLKLSMDTLTQKLNASRFKLLEFKRRER